VREQSWDQFTGEITHEYACTPCKSTIENRELIKYLLLKFPDDDDKKCDEDCTVESLIGYHLQEQCIEVYQCSCCEKNSSATRKSAITKFPSFMCILLCRNKGDDNGTISSAVEFPALGFNTNGDHMPYDLSATVHYKLTKSGNGHYTAITRLFLEVGTCNHTSGSCMMMIAFLHQTSPIRTPW